jgi:hypothetical protein
MIINVIVMILILLCLGVDIPLGAKYVGSGSGSDDNDDCGNSLEYPCSSLMKGYTQSSSTSGTDKQVQILNDISIFGTMTLSNGGIYYTYGIISSNVKPKVIGDNNNFYINSESSTSWYTFFLFFIF